MLWRPRGPGKRGTVSLEGILTVPSVRTGIVCVWAKQCTWIVKNTPKIHPHISRQPRDGSRDPSDPRPSPFYVDCDAHLKHVISLCVVRDKGTCVISSNGFLFALKNTQVGNEPRQSKMTPLDSSSLKEPDSTLNLASPKPVAEICTSGQGPLEA